MKKVFAFLLIAAAAAMVVVSCKKDEEKKDEARFVKVSDLKTPFPSTLKMSLSHSKDYMSVYDFVPMKGKTVLPCGPTYQIKFEFPKGYGKVCIYAAASAKEYRENLKNTEAEWFYALGPGSEAKVGDTETVTMTYEHAGYKIVQKVKVTIVD